MNRIEARNQKRKEVVEAIVVRQEPVHDVARIFNIPQRTVFNWLARYRSDGWDGLKERARCGRPRKLSDEDMSWLYSAITESNPLDYGFDSCLWTLNIVRSMIKQERGVELSKSAVSRLLKHLGLSPQRPLYKSYKQDPKKIEKYLSSTYLEVVEKAKEMDAEIYFVDEAAVRSDAHRGLTWGAIGETPVVKDSGGRFGFKLISAVTAFGDMRFRTIEGKMNSTRFIQFLKKLRKDAGRPIIVIADNARYHHSKETSQFIEEHSDDYFMAFLPPYSPELNPDEQVWNHAKARLGKLPITSAKAMKKAMLSIMRSIQKNQSLIKSFFQLPDTQYIGATINH